MHYTIRQAKLDLERIESCQPLMLVKRSKNGLILL